MANGVDPETAVDINNRITAIKVEVFDLLVEIELAQKELRTKTQAKDKLLQELEGLKKV